MYTPGWIIESQLPSLLPQTPVYQRQLACGSDSLPLPCCVLVKIESDFLGKNKGNVHTAARKHRRGTTKMNAEF